MPLFLGLVMRLLVFYLVFLAGLFTLPSLMISMIFSPRAGCFYPTLLGSLNRHLNGIVSNNRMSLRPHVPGYSVDLKLKKNITL